MVTKEQAMNCNQFLQTHAYRPLRVSNFPHTIVAGNGCTHDADPIGPKPIAWRANGKCKTGSVIPIGFSYQLNMA